MGMLMRMRWWGACAVFAILSSVARADVDVWFEVVSSSGPGAGIVTIDQGAAGKALTITTDQAAGTYQVTITMMAEVPADEALYGYSLDLISPTASNVAVTSLTLLGDFDFDLPIDISSGPGEIINDASQIVFGNLQSGSLELLEFTLTIDRPPGDDVELFCGIGAINWAGLVSPINILYGDSDPLDGETADLVANTPSIIIKQFAPPPPPSTGACCHADGTCTAETAAACGLIGGANYHGDGTDCGTANCPQPPPPTGACCHADGTCSLETSADCQAISGVFRGVATSCAGANCPQPTQNTNSDQSNNQTGDQNSQTLANTTTTSQDQTGTTTADQTDPAHIDRDQLRTLLAGLFGLPINGNDPISMWPVKTMGFLGINMSFVWGGFDLATMPLRFLLYEFTYAILDANLP